MPSAIRVAGPVEPDFLRPWREPFTARTFARNTVASLIFHIFLIWFVIALPEVERAPYSPVIHPDIHKAVHLVAPRIFEPTQKAPNKGKISRELDVRSSNPAPQPQAPRFRPPSPAPGPVAQTQTPASAPPPSIEPPKIEVASAPPPPPPGVPNTPPKPPPPQQAATAGDKPKIAFEDVGSTPVQVNRNPNSPVPMPSTSVQDAAKSARPGAGGTMVGDTGDSLTNIPNASQGASPGRIGSNLQLLSDAKGVDFKPYLIQVLTAVRRNWLVILPESARLGRRGRVLIQFAIDRTGAVPKLVIAEGAGTDALDRAAVAAISASYPFPPLPPDYKGDQIRLQLAFAYNMPTK